MAVISTKNATQNCQLRFFPGAQAIYSGANRKTNSVTAFGDKAAPMGGMRGRILQKMKIRTAVTGGVATCVPAMSSEVPGGIATCVPANSQFVLRV